MAEDLPAAESAGAEPKDVPPLLLSDAGRPVRTAEDWEAERRGELKRWFLENEYGLLPAAAERADVAFEDVEPSRPSMEGLATERRIRATCRGPHDVFSFAFTAHVPVGGKPAPALVLICTRDIRHKEVDLALERQRGYWPAEEIVRRGYAAIAFFNDEVVDETKRLIDECAPGGGFIFETAYGIDYAKVENVEAMFDTVRTYGKKR